MGDQEWKPWGSDDRKEYYAAVGYLCNQWNIVEWFYYRLATDMLHLGREEHDVLFRHFGIVAISQFLKEYAAKHVKAKATREQLQFVTDYVMSCRINRNAIVHGIASVSIDGPFEVMSQADQRRPKPRKFYVTIPEVRQCCDDCERAGKLVMAMQFLLGKEGPTTARSIFGRRWRLRLLSRPGVPKILGASPQAAPKQKRQRRPSRASRRKSV
jgi:hypothetical protein